MRAMGPTAALGMGQEGSGHRKLGRREGGGGDREEHGEDGGGRPGCRPAGGRPLGGAGSLVV